MVVNYGNFGRKSQTRPLNLKRLRPQYVEKMAEKIVIYFPVPLWSLRAPDPLRAMATKKDIGDDARCFWSRAR